MRRRIVEIDGIGKVCFLKSSRTRRLNISLRPFEGLKVSVPSAFSLKAAKGFVEAHADWIRKNFKKVSLLEKQYAAVCDQLSEDRPHEADLKLILRTRELAGRYGFKFKKIVIRNQKTLWGSCSYKNVISLNRKLMRLPQELIDYVIVHELLHTRIKNHKSNFWKALDEIVGNAKILRARVRQFSLALL